MPGTPTSVTSCGSCAVAGAGERLHQSLKFGLSADERRAAGLADVDALPGARRHGLPDGNRLGLALRHHRCDGVVVDDCLCGVECARAHEHAVGRRRSLQPRSGIHDVTLDHRLAKLGAGIDVDQNLARVDRDAQFQVFLLARPVAYGERRSDCAFGIIFVRRRRAENGHDRVADELLDSAAVALEIAAQAVVIGPQDALDIFRIQLLGAGGEANQVGEDHADDFALFA